jgi:amino acid transporter
MIPDRDQQQADDTRNLQRLGYAQELLRRMSGFSNFAISLSIICILAGGVTSFDQGFFSVGGASIGVGWPLVTVFALAVAATMGQVASAFPTAGGLYHWATILGGRGWGWATAWFNLAGLIAVLAAINGGTIDYAADWLAWKPSWTEKTIAVATITLVQSLLNQFGIRLTTRLTDLSGWWILAVSVMLTAALLIAAPSLEPMRLFTFSNYSGFGNEPIWPHHDSIPLLFALGLLLPAYTLTGFDASAHVAEETVGAATQVPRAIVRSVWVSGLFGWAMLSAVVLAMPSLNAASALGQGAFNWTLNKVFAPGQAKAFFVTISIAHFLCGLATVTSASRMAYAFARDGGLPLSRRFRQVSPVRRSPVAAIWLVGIATVVLVATIPYATVAAFAAVLLYVSYVLPTAMGLIAYNRQWTRMGPWHLGRWYRPLAAVAIVGCGFLMVIGCQPPNEVAGEILGGFTLALLVGWLGYARRHFPGPPHQLLESEHAERKS